ncbi:MAG: glycerate kinase [Clostridia bacterium]|nr:glycerate kinase [Clostridia bacterium]
MKIVICPDSFKGTLAAKEASEAIRRAAEKIFPEAETCLLPLGDGGEGTKECFMTLGAVEKSAKVRGPYGEELEAKYLLFPDGKTAYVESAEAAGLTKSELRITEIATTYGVGELIMKATEDGAEKVLLGLGGSGTSDMGLGMASAMGFTFYDDHDIEFIPTGRSLRTLSRFERPEGKIPAITALCDVENPLCGEKGSAAIFGPQKGADEKTIAMLDEGMRHASSVIDIEKADLPGAGAAGGMGYAVLALFGGELERGIDVVSHTVGLDEAIRSADLVVTGEGSFDGQSMMGKAVGGIASRAKKAGVPLYVLCGRAGEVGEAYLSGVSAVFPMTNYPVGALLSASETEKALEKTAENLFRTIKISE